MYYLQRGGADPEGPYSLEYLARMAREGKLSPADSLIDAASNQQSTVGEQLGHLSDASWRPEKSSVSGASIAVIGMILLAGLCLLPILTMLPSARTRSGGIISSPGRASGSVVANLEALRAVTRATEMYCYQHDGFFPSGMDSDQWKEQILPYLNDRSALDLGPEFTLGANPNLNNIRQGSVIDPYRTLMFYIMPSSGQGEAGASNVDGRVGIVPAEGLQKSIDSGIFNVPD